MLQEEKQFPQSWSAEALEQAFEREGCPVCLAILETLQRAIVSWSYEGFTDVEQRHLLIRSRGFCPLHTWQLAQFPTAFQLGLVYHEIITDMLASMEKPTLPSRTNWHTTMRQILRNIFSTHRQQAIYAACLFCQKRTQVELRLVDTLLQLLQFEEGRMRFAQTTGLCRVHFAQACKQVHHYDKQVQTALVVAQRVCYQRIVEELEALIRNYEYHASQQVHGAEMTAWRRAAEICAGNPGVY